MPTQDKERYLSVSRHRPQWRNSRMRWRRLNTDDRRCIPMDQALSLHEREKEKGTLRQIKEQDGSGIGVVVEQRFSSPFRANPNESPRARTYILRQSPQKCFDLVYCVQEIRRAVQPIRTKVSTDTFVQ
jgi:hypothetical protein